MTLYQIFIVVSFQIFQIESVTIGKFVKNDKLVIGISVCLSSIILCIITNPHYIIVRSNFKDCHLVRGQDVSFDRLVCWFLIVPSHVRVDIISFYHHHSLCDCQPLLVVAHCQGDAALALRCRHLRLGGWASPWWEVVERLGVDGWQRQPRPELDLDALRVGVAGDSRGELALVDVYGGRQRTGLGGDNVPGTRRALQVERLEWWPVLYLGVPGHRQLLGAPGLQVDQERSGLAVVESLVRAGSGELQQVPSVAGDLVVQQRRPDVSNLEGQTGAWRELRRQFLQRRNTRPGTFAQLEGDSDRNPARQEFPVLLAPTPGSPVAVREDQLLHTPDLPERSVVKHQDSQAN